MGYNPVAKWKMNDSLKTGGVLASAKDAQEFVYWMSRAMHGSLPNISESEKSAIYKDLSMVAAVGMLAMGAKGAYVALKDTGLSGEQIYQQMIHSVSNNADIPLHLVPTYLMVKMVAEDTAREFSKKDISQGSGDETHIGKAVPPNVAAVLTSGGGKAAITTAAIAALVADSGCLGSGDGNPGDKPDPAEPGRIMIRTINENYPGVNEVPDAEKQIAVFEKLADDMSAGEPLIKLKALPYAIKPLMDGEQKAEDGSIYGKSIKPINYDKLGKISPDMATEAFDADYTGVSYLAAYLDGKIDETKFMSLFSLDGDSQKEITMMKTKGLSIDNFYVTDGVGIKGDENVKYLINTYQTKPDASKQVLTGYLHMKLEKKGTTGKWVPTKVIESEVYTPKGELGFYYVGEHGSDYVKKKGKGFVTHAWIEKKKGGIPLIPEAIENTGKTVDQYVRSVFGKDVSEGVVMKHYEGGRVVTLTNGVSKTVQIPAGNYEVALSTDVDSPGIFNEVSASIQHKNGVILDAMAVSEAYRGGKPAGLAWLIKQFGTSGIVGLNIKDGFLTDTVVAADGTPDAIQD